MPRAKPLDTYPNSHYWAAVQRCLTSDEPFLIKATRQQAASLRGEMHAWRRACEDSSNVDQLQRWGINRDDMRRWFLAITDAGLEIRPARMMIGLGLIESALGEEPPKPVDPADQALRDFLARKEGEK